MLKPNLATQSIHGSSQPPSGGCVLKRMSLPKQIVGWPAAFRRLCVETNYGIGGYSDGHPAAFRRLCVETRSWSATVELLTPAAFRRLCVETAGISAGLLKMVPAAFRRLCVETARRRHG